MNYAQIIALIFTLKAQVLTLQNELAAMQSSTVVMATTTPIVYAPQEEAWVPPMTSEHAGFSAPTQNIVLGASEPTSTAETCTLSVVPIGGSSEYTSDNGQFTWSSTGIPENTAGELYFTYEDGNPIKNGGILLKPYNNSPTSIPSANGQIVIPDGQGPAFTSDTDVFQLDIGNATCTASWMGVDPDGSQYVPQN